VHRDGDILDDNISAGGLDEALRQAGPSANTVASSKQPREKRSRRRGPGFCSSGSNTLKLGSGPRHQPWQ
jgi:hypothetical protein